VANYYVNSVAYAAVAQWAAGHGFAAGSIVRQLATPALGSERCFRTAAGGTSGGSEPAWVLSQGAAQPTDGTITDWLEVTGSESYTSPGAWRAPFKRIGSVGWGSQSPGDFVYVSSNHNVNDNGVDPFNGVSFGTNNPPVNCICIDESASGHIPPQPGDFKTGAKEQMNQLNGWIGPNNNLIFNGIELIYNYNQLTFCGTQGGIVKFENSILRCLQGQMNLSGQQGGVSEFVNTPFDLAGIPVSCQGTSIWRDTPNAILGTAPAALLSFPNQIDCDLTLENVDLSAMSGKKLIAFGSQNSPFFVRLNRCKLPASFGVLFNAMNDRMSSVQLLQCDSGGNTFRHEKYVYDGSQIVETAIVRSGGATDGVTPIAWKIVTNSGARWQWPYESLPMSVWNKTTGSPKTVTVFGVWGDGAVPNNDEIWIEVLYLSAAGTVSSTRAKTTKANVLSAGVACAADGSTWGGSTTAFKMSATFTPQEKGYFAVVVKAAKASSTFYIDPQPVIT
jgi:hypothetical protein